MFNDRRWKCNECINFSETVIWIDLKRKTNQRISFRNLEFLCCFLQEFSQGDKTVEETLNKSYGQTLKHFHHWNTRQTYSVNELNRWNFVFVGEKLCLNLDWFEICNYKWRILSFVSNWFEWYQRSFIWKTSSNWKLFSNRNQFLFCFSRFSTKWINMPIKWKLFWINWINFTNKINFNRMNRSINSFFFFFVLLSIN